MLTNCRISNAIIVLLTCIGTRPCPFPGDLRCNSSQACIRSDQWCDNEIDCDDESDESDCCKHHIASYVCILWYQKAYNSII